MHDPGGPLPGDDRTHPEPAERCDTVEQARQDGTERGGTAVTPGLDLVPEAVVVLDVDDRVVDLNDRARPLLGLGPQSLGKPVAELVDVFDEAREPCAGGLAPPRAKVDRLAETVLRVRLSDGRLRTVTRTGRFLDDGRVVLSFRHAGRREIADRKRSDLVATVSHEIRSPLTSVKGFTRTLLTKWERFSDEQKRTMLETINVDADRVTRLLGELLDVSRIDAGRVQMHRRMVDLAAIVDTVVDRVEHRPEGTGRRIDVALPGDLPDIYADPDKIEQIITNLVDNALKYNPASVVRVRGEVRDDEVELRVEDDGAGIPPDQLRAVFTKFFRVKGNRVHGTGLGLYITKGLVQAHNGRVWAESTEGEGTTFHVVFPRGGIELGQQP